MARSARESGAGATAGVTESRTPLGPRCVDDEGVVCTPDDAPPTPVLPENRLIANGERVQEDADLARFRGGTALPLALLSSKQGRQLRILAPYTTRRLPSASRHCSWTEAIARLDSAASIRLERKIGSGEAVSFPGGGRGGWGIPCSGYALLFGSAVPSIGLTHPSSISAFRSDDRCRASSICFPHQATILPKHQAMRSLNWLNACLTSPNSAAAQVL